MTSCETITAAASVVGIMITLDVVSGIASAASRGELRTSKLREGLMHKLALVLTIVLAIALEYASDVLPIDVKVPLVIPVCAYITLMEACSVYENIKSMNPDVRVQSFEDLFQLPKTDGEPSDRETPDTDVSPEFIAAAERYMQKFIEEQEAHDAYEGTTGVPQQNREELR